MWLTGMIMCTRISPLPDRPAFHAASPASGPLSPFRNPQVSSPPRRTRLPVVVDVRARQPHRHRAPVVGAVLVVEADGGTISPFRVRSPGLECEDQDWSGAGGLDYDLSPAVLRL